MDRFLNVKVSSYVAKKKMMGEDEYLVVPVTMLVPGVIHPMNVPEPERVTLESFEDAATAFNGRPLMLDHPLLGGAPVLANRPEVLPEAVGLVLNAKVSGSKLKAEAWINVKKASQTEKGLDLLARARAGEDIEVSVGVTCEDIGGPGVEGGQAYATTWGPIVPDHLAMLSEGHTGACSVEMGCGVRAAKSGGDNVKSMYTEWLEPGPETDALLKTLAEGAQFKGLRDIPQSERDKMGEDEFAGPNRSFPIQQAGDVAAAAQALGRAKGNRAAIKRRIINIAYRKGDAFVAQLPADWQKKSVDTKAAAKTGLLEKVLGLFRTRAAQNVDTMTGSDLTQRLYQALYDKEPELVCVETYFPVTDPAHVVYSVREANGLVDPYGQWPLYDYVTYERAFDLSDSGVVTLNDARIEVEPVTTWEPVEGASPKAAATKTACSCQDTKDAITVPAVPASQEKIMKDATTKVLAAVTPEQEDAIVAFAANGFKAATVEVVKEVIKEVPVAPVEMTREQAIEKFGLGDAVKVAADKRAASVKTLKDSGRCTIADEKLNAMTQDELDGLVKLMGTAPAAAPKAKTAVDFGVRAAAGAVEGTDDQQVIAPPQSIDEKIKAARTAKK